MYDLAEEYLIKCQTEGLTKTTVSHKRQLLKQFFKWLESKDVDDLEDVTSGTVRKWILWEQEKGNKGNSINGKIQHLRPFFKWLVEEEIIDRNPWKGIKLLKCNPPKIKAYDKQDILAMLDYWNNNSFISVRNKTIITVLAETGIRNSELRNIRIGDIYDNSIAILGKGNKMRHVPISKILSVQLRKYLRVRKKYLEQFDEETDVLFINRLRRRMTRQALLKMIREMGEELGIDVSRSIHNFRRFYMQEMVMKVDIYTLAKTVGHSKITTTQRYLESIVDERIIEIASRNSPLSGGKTK
jgi:integrase/recombinase XerD